MKNFSKKFFISVFLLIVIAVFAFAQQLHIFIHNKPYKGDYIYQGNRIYVEINQFVKMTNLKMYNQGNYYVLSDKTIVPPASFTSLVYYNNKPLKYVIFQNSKVYVDLFELSYFTNSMVEFNKETGIVDYYSKAKVELTAQQVYQASEQIYNTQKDIYSTDKKKIQVGEKPKIPADAIKIIDENPQYEDKNNRGELRYTAKVKNTYKETIEDIKIKIKIVSPANDVLHEEKFTFSLLKSSESKEISFYWINNTSVPFPQIKHEIHFKGKEEQEQK
ncbi:MAG: hypothetical protein NZM44_05550 [Candidatus Calescibacterium sp.]|nr:hypothetical protein [Candidatus Calescibacterium sp.]